MRVIRKLKRFTGQGLNIIQNHEVAKSQMKDFGGMISFTTKGDSYDQAKKIVENLKIFTLAESLGGVESLSGHPAKYDSCEHSKRRERKKQALLIL